MACFYLFDIYRWINDVRGEGWYASRGTTCGTTTTTTDKSDCCVNAVVVFEAAIESCVIDKVIGDAAAEKRDNL